MGRKIYLSVHYAYNRLNIIFKSVKYMLSVVKGEKATGKIEHNVTLLDEEYFLVRNRVLETS